MVSIDRKVPVCLKILETFCLLKMPRMLSTQVKWTNTLLYKSEVLKILKQCQNRLLSHLGSLGYVQQVNVPYEISNSCHVQVHMSGNGNLCTVLLFCRHNNLVYVRADVIPHLLCRWLHAHYNEHQCSCCVLKIIFYSLYETNGDLLTALKQLFGGLFRTNASSTD